MTGKHKTLILDLRRESPKESWGFSIVGGSDQGAPLIVTKVNFGPVSQSLQRGDVITKIGNYDVRDVRHQDAQTLFKNATNIRVVVQRDSGHKHNTSTGSSACSSQNYTPLSISPALSPRGQNFNSSALSPGAHSLHSLKENGEEMEHVENQPYRTTPLVLPGAKVKKEAGPTESYLRHHPNPAVRSSPHHVDHDFAMKQRVADSVIQRVVAENPTHKQVVHKQFNSPIGLYSESNIVDTIKQQTGITPSNGAPAPVPKGVAISKKYDPLQSETFKAVQEEQSGLGYVYEMPAEEVGIPVQTKIFTPHKVMPVKKPVTVTKPAPPSPHQMLNSLGAPNDEIQQSGSFKRLMHNVLANY